MRIMGLDPGLRKTGWGVIEAQTGRISHIANGVVASTASLSLGERLLELFEGLNEIITAWAPEAAAVEETFVNKNPVSTLKLGQARGIALLAPSLAGVIVAEYAPNKVKKTVVGVGHADKKQVDAMVKMMLPGIAIKNADAADALAVAICHAHHLDQPALKAALAAEAAKPGTGLSNS